MFAPRTEVPAIFRSSFGLAVELDFAAKKEQQQESGDGLREFL